jgi:hypothetical protein
MRRTDRMSLKTTIALMAVVLLFGFGGVMWWYAVYKVEYTQYFDILVKTSEGKTIGFNADPTLHFGSIPVSGGKSMKEMVLGNDKYIPLLVQIRVSGDAAQFIQPEDNNFMLQPGEVKKLKVYAVIPEGFGQVGNFTGTAKVIYFRP